METFRCPTCLFVLTGPEQRRCPSCRKRLRRRGRPIVLGGDKQSAPLEPPDVDVVYAVLVDDASEPVNEAPPVVAPAPPPPPTPAPAPAEISPPVAIAPVVQLPVAPEIEPVAHTTIFAPSQFDPEMRQVLDDLYRKARAEVEEDEQNQSA